MRTTDQQLPVGPTAVVTKGAYTRPNLAHWLLSKLPAADKTGYRWFGAIAEPIFVLTVVWVASWTDEFPVTALGVALLVVVTTPQLVRSDRPGNPGFDPTKLGLSMSAVGTGSMVPWLVSGNPVWLVIGAVMTSLVVLTDRMALCSHGVAMLAVAVVNPPAIGVLIGGVGLAVVISRGRAVRFLLAHVKFILDSLKEKPYTNPGGGWTRFTTEVRQQLTPLSDPVEAVGVFNPFVVTGGITVLMGLVGVFELTTVDVVFAAWLIGGIVGFVDSSLPQADIIGPSDVFLLGVVVPAAMLTGRGIETLGPIYTAVVVAAALVGSLFTVMGGQRVDQSESDEAWTELVDALDGFEPSVVLLDPADRASELAYVTDHCVTDVLHNEEASTNDLDILFPEEHLCLPDTPTVVMSIKYYFNPDLAVFNRKRVDLPETVPQSAVPIYENSRYQVFDFDNIVG
jgi:hypothetical protein